MLYVYLKSSHKAPPGCVTLGDVAALYDDEGQKLPSKLVLGRVNSKGLLLIRELDVIKKLSGRQVTTLGAPSCAVTAKLPEKAGVPEYLKAAFVTLFVFFGGAMTIMNFHSDVSMPDTHNALSQLLTGSLGYSRWVSVVYSIGVAAGVLLFCNMLPGRKEQPNIFDVEQFELENQTQDLLRSRQEDSK